MKRCYYLTGLTNSDLFSCNTGFIVGDKEVVVIDTGNNIESARTICEFISAVAPNKPITKVINLEQHYDHIFGNFFYR